MLTYLEWAVWLIGAYFAGSWNLGIRQMSKAASGVTISTVVTTMCWTASVITVLLVRVSPLHLLWLFPIGFLGGLLSMMSPFGYLLQPLGRLYARVVSF